MDVGESRGVVQAEDGIQDAQRARGLGDVYTGQGEKQTRTPLTEEVKSLDERKNKKKSLTSSPVYRPKKRIIYDDFGEPVREVWE